MQLFPYKQLQLHLKHRQTFFRILLSHAAISLCILTLSTLTLYTMFSRTAVKEIGYNADTQLRQLANSTSFMLDFSSSYALKWSQDSEIMTFALQSIDTPMGNYRVFQKLNEILNNNPFVESIYILNENTKLVASTRTGITPKDNFYDLKVWDLIQSLPRPYLMSVTPRIIDTNSNGEKFKTRVISIIVPYDPKRGTSAFVVNIDSDKLYNFLGQTQYREEGEVFLIDDKGRILSSANPDLFLKSLPQNSFAYRIPYGSGAGWFETDNEEGRQIVSYAALSSKHSEGWKLVEKIPQRTLFAPLAGLRDFTYLLYSIIFLITIVAVWKLSKLIYSPIEALVRDVRRNREFATDGQLDEAMGEMSLLAKTLLWQKSQIHKISADWARSRPLAREALLKNLLHGNVTYSPNQYEQLCREHRLNLSVDSLVVAVIRIDRFEEFVYRYAPFHQRLMRYAMANITSETMANGIISEVADISGDHLGVLVHEERGMREQVIGRLRQCQINIRNFLLINTTVGVSAAVEHYSDLPGAYEQALDLTNERFKEGGGGIHEFNPGWSMDLYVYPEELEKKMAAALTAGHKEEFEDYLASFIGVIMRYTPGEIRLALIQLLFGFGKIFSRLMLEPDSGSLRSLSSIQQQLDRLETLDQTREWIHSLAAEVFRQQSARKNGRYAKLLQEISDTVNRRLDDPNLCSQFIADALGMSVNYLRPLFKEETGQSLSDYITSCRLDKVKNLLVRTDLSVEAICRQTGFQSPNSFYAIFKKQFGLTPKQYRRQNGEGTSRKLPGFH